MNSTALEHNLRFLVVEVRSQLETLQAFFESGSATLARRVVDRRGYARNLEARISEAARLRPPDDDASGPNALALRAYEQVSAEVGRISGLCIECIQHVDAGKRMRSLDAEALGPLLELVSDGLAGAQEALAQNDTRQALELVEIERRLDEVYEQLLKSHIRELRDTRHPEDVVSALFVARTVEEMGDALQRTGEAILSANIGRPLDIARYDALTASFAKLDDADGLEEFQLNTLATTRSGGTISAVSRANDEDGRYMAVFKDGAKRKLKKERRRVESWHEIYPGLAPKILSYKKRGQSAALLIEHLAGLTFEQVVLRESAELIEEALSELARTLRNVWTETRTDKPVCAGFARQAQSRMAEVYAVHPSLRHGDAKVCGRVLPSFDSLLERARTLEGELGAPFSVYIHGDFNVDNIIYDPLDRRINFIDLHRSRYTDYVQDASVFMVSNFRLRVLDADARRRILRVARDFYRFASGFAAGAGDATFELRLALGLARSFATSTRFILDKTLARDMFIRARYLLEAAVTAAEAEPESFIVPIQEIFHA